MNSLQQIVRLRDDPMAMQEWLGKHPLYDLKERVCTRSTVDDFDKREDWVDERLLLGRYLYSIAKLYHQAQPPHSASNSGLHSGVDHSMRCSNRLCSEAIGVWNDACKLYHEHVLPRKKGSGDLQDPTEQPREAHFLSLRSIFPSIETPSKLSKNTSSTNANKFASHDLRNTISSHHISNRHRNLLSSNHTRIRYRNWTINLQVLVVATRQRARPDGVKCLGLRLSAPRANDHDIYPFALVPLLFVKI
jgi:hypothetical protein